MHLTFNPLKSVSLLSSPQLAICKKIPTTHPLATPYNPLQSHCHSANNQTQATGGKDMSSGGFAARAQSAGDRNANANAGAGSAGGSSGGGNSGGQGGWLEGGYQSGATGGK